MDNLDDFFTYDELLIEPMGEFGWEIDFVSWRDKTADWNRYEAVVIRSPWDYQDDPELFMNVLEKIDATSAQLENKLETVKWNIDKTYLQDMQDKGIKIVPTLWYESWDQVTNVQYFFDELQVNEIIIKPTLSANADDTYRIKKQDISSYKTRLKEIFERRPFMVQPFLESIITEGEFSLFYFGSAYSHAIIKKPRKGDFRVQEEHGGTLHKHIPDEELKSIARKTMQNIHPLPLYSRVDFARLPDGSYGLMELELIEPSLYFNMDEESPKLFAKVFNEWMS
ncbi:MAG: hypothetical protein U5J95_03945 [Balneolaceae bacterium]|nr:hypothetical protein [Balneolaceae bacterium]